MVALLARTILWMVLGLSAWATVPALFGGTATTVHTGSMAPRIRPGDVVVAAPVTTPAIGQVLLVEDPDHAGRLRLHRFVRVDVTDQLVLRGDANGEDDSSPVPMSAVTGVGMLRVPWIGAPAMWFQQGRWLELAVAGTGVVLLLGATRLDRRVRADATAFDAAGTASGEIARERAPRPRADSRRPRRRRRLTPRRAARGGAVVLLVVAGLGAGGSLSGRPSSAAFTATTANGPSVLRSAATYDCVPGTALDAPYLRFTFSEATGTTTADDSGNGRQGTLNGTARRVAGDCADGGTSLSPGADGHVSTDDRVAVRTTLSLEAWVRTDAGGRIIGLGTSRTGPSARTDRVLYVTPTGQLAFGVSTGVPLTPNAEVQSTRSVADGSWHHVVAVMSSSMTGMATLTLYIDGSPASSSRTFSLGSGTLPSTAWYWRVGADSMTGWTPNAASSFTGLIDDVAVYERALTAQQVAQHHAVGR